MFMKTYCILRKHKIHVYIINLFLTTIFSPFVQLLNIHLMMILVHSIEYLLQHALILEGTT